MLNRVVRAALLQASVYRELRDDPAETFIALGVVVLSGAAIGAAWPLQQDAPLAGAPIWLTAMIWVWLRLMGWFLWAGVAYVVGSKLLGGAASFRQLLRSVGFAFGTGMFAVVALIPAVWPAVLELNGGAIAFQSVMSVSLLWWVFPAGWVAIRETQGFDWVRSLICAIMAWMVGTLGLPLLVVNSLSLGGGGAG